MSTNKAAYQPAKKAGVLQVKEAPFPSIANDKDKIIIRNRALAINPVDWLIQTRGDLMFTWLKYPFILGHDVAGEVIAAGPNVSDFKPGDRVLAWAGGTTEKVNDSAQGAFQEIVVVRPGLTTKIPTKMSFEAAATIPLGIATASEALFGSAHLGLDYPTEPKRPSNGKTVIVWGGSTSVGCNGIQLAVAAGYEVFTTASPKNFDLVRSLGASQVFDYNSSTVVPDMLRALKGHTVVGAVSIGEGAAEKCMAILGQVKAERKHIAMATFPVSSEEPKSLPMLRTVASLALWMSRFKTKGLAAGISSAFVMVHNIRDNAVGPAIFNSFLPAALAAGTYNATPAPFVTGEGIDAIQNALEVQKKGVSAKKVVVLLP